MPEELDTDMQRSDTPVGQDSLHIWAAHVNRIRPLFMAERLRVRSLFSVSVILAENVTWPEHSDHLQQQHGE